MTTAQEVLTPADAVVVGEFAGKVRAELGSDILDLRLFGSKATGRSAADSDIDILVVVAEARTEIEDRILAVALDVSLAHDVFISPIVVGRATLEDPVWRITPFLKAALAGVAGVTEELKALACHRVAAAGRSLRRGRRPSVLRCRTSSHSDWRGDEKRRSAKR